jgi:SAM-dependent methyltransferase
LAEAHGGDVRAVDWGSRASQELRFSVLASIGDLRGARVLDVGCGQGDLCGWLAARGIECEYTGIDLSPRMVALARKRYPRTAFEVRNVLEDQRSCAPWDFVLASGIFYLRQDAPEEYLRAMVEALFARCTRGLAFNSLSLWSPARAEPGEFRADPVRTLTMAARLTPRLSLRHDYHPGDFSLLLHRDGAA